MKPLLYIGAALMIGAGTYGFVDYKKKSRSKELQSLYTKEEKKEVKESIPAPDIPEAVPAAMVSFLRVKETTPPNPFACFEATEWLGCDFNPG